MQECCIFLNAFPSPDSLTPPGQNDSMGVELKAPLCKGGSREAGGGLWPYPKIELPRKVTIPQSASLTPLTRPDPSVAARHLPPLWGVTLCTREPLLYVIELFWPRRGQCGGRRKSVKKNAALLHFLAFSLTDPRFGVLRGEQPLSRGSLPRNSETFFASFFGHKKGRTTGSMTSPPERAAAGWRQAEARQ